MRRRSVLALFVILLLPALPAAAQYRAEYPLPAPGGPASLGVNIHFTDPRPGEMEQLAAAGFRWIRMDFTWGAIERVRGRYDFSAYDGLMARLKERHIRPIFILDYGNDLYQEGSPRTDGSRAAFARFAAAAVAHFKGRGVLWEMWNEPNGNFWTPRPDVDEYIALALETGKAIRAAAPYEWYIGPGVSGMDFDFMEKCFKAGLLEYWDAVSFHPYRNSPPETAEPDFLRLRGMIDRYAPPGHRIPMINSEWGYSEKYPGLDLEKQSRYIVRQALTNVANGLRVSIWYDWHDDGVDPKEPEHHFGAVYNDYRPKPTYQAIATLTRTLRDCRFDKRLSLDAPADYCLLFESGSGPRLTVWTSDPKPHEARIPASPGSFDVINMLGAPSRATADATGLRVTLTGAPQYLVPRGENALIGRALRWRALPQSIQIDTPEELGSALGGIASGRWTPQDRSAVANVEMLWGPGAIQDVGGPPTYTPVRRPPRQKGSEKASPLDERIDQFVGLIDAVSAVPYRSDASLHLLARIKWLSGAVLSQETVITGRHPLLIVPEPVSGGRVPVRVENQTGALFSGRISLDSASAPSEGVPLRFNEGQTEQTVDLPVNLRPDGSYRIGVRIATQFGAPGRTRPWTTVAVSPEIELVPLERFAAFQPGAELPTRAYRVVPDGDPKVKSTIRVAVAPAPEGLAGPQARAIRIDYVFDKGWKFLRLEPENEERAPLPGKPRELGAWVYGDGSGDVLNARFTDSGGQTFQPTAGRIDWRGWRFVTFSLEGENSGHWGGADDGVVHYPIHLDTLLLVDSPGGRGGKGTLYATAFTLMTPVAP